MTAILIGGANSNTQVRCNKLGQNYHTGIMYNRNMSYSLGAQQLLSIVPNNPIQPGATSTLVAANEFTPDGTNIDMDRIGTAAQWNFGSYYFKSDPSTNWYKQIPTTLNNLTLGVDVMPLFTNLPNITSNTVYCASPNGLVATTPIAPPNCYTSAFAFPSINPTPNENIEEGTIFEAAIREIADILTDLNNATEEAQIEQLKAELIFAMQVQEVGKEDGIAFLQNQNTPEDDKYLLDVYIGEDRITEASGILNILPTNNIDELAYKQLYEIFIDLKLQDRTLEELTQSEKELIEAILGLDNPSSGLALNILGNYFDWDYTVPCEKKGYCNGTSQRKAQTDHIAMFNNAMLNLNAEREAKSKNGALTAKQFRGITVSLQPNPASNVLNINYTLPTGSENATLMISNVTGGLVQTIALDAHTRTKTLNISNLSNGVYNLTLKSNNNVVHQKFVVNH